MKRHEILSILTVLVVAYSCFGLTAQGATIPVTEEEVNDAIGLDNSSLQRLYITENHQGDLQFVIDLEDREYNLNLMKHSMRSEDFQVLVQYEPDGDLIPVEVPECKIYRGTIPEFDGALVGASYKDGKLTAMIFTENAEYTVEPLVKHGFENTEGCYVIYNTVDVNNIGEHTCATTEDMRIGEIDDNVPDPMDTGNRIADLAVDAGFYFYQWNGSSITNTIDDIENVLNDVEIRYEVTGIMITYEVTTIVVRTVAVYTTNDPSGLLNQFTNRWNTAPEASIRRDTAHLFTGRELTGVPVGIAWLGTLCNIDNHGYGLSQSNFTTYFPYRMTVTAHEIGHNWNASHCDGDGDCRIMCSSVGGCTGSVYSFGSRAVGEISSFRNSSTCLFIEPDPVAFPFDETFPGISFSDNWVYLRGTSINTNAENEPSSPYSVNLDATGSGDYQDNELRSGFILLGGMSDLAFSYYTQHIGVDNGEELVVEYWGDDLMWHEINRITSDGIDQTTFDFYEHTLPADAYHDEFRIAFRAEVSGSDDDWYVDDVSIDDPFPACFTCIATSQSPRVPNVNGLISWDMDVTNCGGADEDVYGEIYLTVGDCAGTQYDYNIYNNVVNGLAPGNTYTGYYHYDPGTVTGIVDAALNIDIGSAYEDYIANCCFEFIFTYAWGRPGNTISVGPGEWSEREDGIILPSTTALKQNYPNPFNASTSIAFDISEAGNANLSVYNLSGQKVETLVDRFLQVGQHDVIWNASTFSSGIYFYKLSVGSNSLIKQMTLLK
ncbi:MAG: T9SS type A sorting domain-containing protein [candidate division Zixibacteria bacterium]|nr:T9SS type A sorting domain-containing protein [candidate division Zixibacteria bacterium]